jgi:hypothetical protein
MLSRRILVVFNDALAKSHSGSLSAVGDLQFGADVVDMIPNRVVTNLKGAGDLLIG